jgi:hypothetical protein
VLRIGNNGRQMPELREGDEMTTRGIDTRDGRHYTKITDQLIDILGDAVGMMQTAGKYTANCQRYAMNKLKLLSITIQYNDSSKASHDRTRADRHLLRLYRSGKMGRVTK